MDNRISKLEIKCSNGEAVQLKNAVINIEEFSEKTKVAISKSDDMALSFQEMIIQFLCKNHPDIISGKKENPESIRFPVDIYTQQGGLNIFYNPKIDEEKPIASILERAIRVVKFLREQQSIDPDTMLNNVKH